MSKDCIEDRCIENRTVEHCRRCWLDFKDSVSPMHNAHFTCWQQFYDDPNREEFKNLARPF